MSAINSRSFIAGRRPSLQHRFGIWGDPVMVCLRLLVAVIAVWYAMHETLNASASTKWPSVTGQVVEKKIETIKSQKLFVKDRLEPQVKYKYSVGGHHYVCDRIQYGGVNTEKPQDTLNRYSTKVSVHYDPENPQEACLETGVNYSFLIGSLTFAGLMLVLMLSDRKR